MFPFQPDYQKLFYLSTYFAAPFAPVDPGAPLPVPNPNATQVYPNPTFTTTSAPTNPIITYFYTSGNQIVDYSGATVQFTGVNWCASPPFLPHPILPVPVPVSDNTIDCISRSLARYGFEGTAFIPQGLWVRGYRSLLDQVKALGFNLLRLPFSGQMLLDSSVASGINGAANPDLVGLTPLQCMDKIVAYGGLIGLRVLLVRASSKVGGGVSADSALATLTHSLTRSLPSPSRPRRITCTTRTSGTLSETATTRRRGSSRIGLCWRAGIKAPL